MAFAGLPNKTDREYGANDYRGVNTNAPLYGQDDALALQPDVSHLGRLDPLPVAIGTIEGKTYSLPDFVCADYDDNCYCASVTSPTFYHDGANVGVPLLGQGVLIEIPKDGNGYLCSLDGVWQYIYDYSGDLDISFEIWSSAGGVPGALLAQEIRAVNTLNGFVPSGVTGWNYIDFSSHGLYFNSDFIVTMSPVLNSGSNPGSDYFVSIWDNGDGSATTPRNGVSHWGDLATWLENDQRWSFDYSPRGSAEICCEELPFTDCKFQTDMDLDCYAFIFSIPNAGNCRQGFADRYMSQGYDTVVSVRLGLTDQGGGPEPGAAFLVEVLGDDGAGVPDPTNVLFSTILGGAGNELDIIPYGLGAFESVDVPVGIVIPPNTTYHVAVRWAGPVPHNGGFQMFMGADDFNSGCNSAEGTSVFWPGTFGTVDPTCPPSLDGWFAYNDAFGYNPDFWIEAEVCRDEYTDCELAQNSNGLPWFRFPYMDYGSYVDSMAGVYTAGGAECRIESYSGMVRQWTAAMDGIELTLMDNVGGAPGNVIYSEFFPTSSFPTDAGPDTVGGASGFDFTLTVYPNAGAGVSVFGDYFVVGTVVWNDAPANVDGWQFNWKLDDYTIDPTPCGQTLVHFADSLDNGDGYGSDPDAGTWADLCYFYQGVPLNWVTTTYRCCIPFAGVACAPAPDWPTYQHDYARTGHSMNALGEANCNLTALWSVNSDVNHSFSGSVIFDDKVIISDDYGYDCRDLATGALIWDQDSDPTVSGLFTGNLGNKTQPTVADIAALGIKVAFLGSAFKRDLVAVDANTGAYLWHATGGGNPFPGLQPKVDNAKSVVWNDGADDVLFYAAEGSVFAVYAATGLPYAGWATNPVDLSSAGANLNAVSTDGSQLFVPTYSGAVPGNLYAIDCATGAINWDLATVTGNAGLEAGVQALSNYDGNEGFWSGATYDEVNDVVWANSYLLADHPAEGFLYRIAADGSGYSAAASTRSRRATPTLDLNSVYVPVFTRWNGPAYDGFGRYDRATGGLQEGIDGKIAGDRQYNDGVLSCEPGLADDWWILGTELGQLNFFQMGNLNTWSFSRVTTLSGGGGGQWAGGSMTTDALVFTNFAGTTVRFGPGPDRPRLDLLATSSSVAVPFGTAVGVSFPFGDMITNLGCVDLTIDSVTLDENPAPVASNTEIEFTSVSPQLLAKMREYANHNTNAAQFEKIALMLGERDNGITDVRTIEVSSTLNYRAASAFPAVVDGASGFNGVDVPAPGTNVAPGAVQGIDIYANGPAVTRGPHAFYASIYTNDPDYYVDDFAKPAEVQLIFVGGCVEDSTVLEFGVGSTNFTVVWNTANIAYFTSEGDHSVNINGYEAGGAQGEPFGAIRGYMVTGRRMAMTGQSWDGSGDNYFSILGDPNYCDNACKPALATNVLLGEISTDLGATYTPVMGNVAAATYIDSVRDYDDGAGGWNTQTLPLTFNNDSTMGFIANETHYGAVDVAELADFKLVRVDVTNRSASDSINHLVHWAHHDYDLGGAGDSQQGRPDKGYIYASTPGTGVVADGYVKVPFGCGAGSDFNYIINGVSCDQTASWWSFDDNNYAFFMDSVGQGLKGLNTLVYQPNMNTFPPASEGGAASDASGDWYFGAMDIGPSETKSFGFAQFAFLDVVDPDDDDQFIGFADMINKWAGWGRGDVNNDMTIDLADIIYLAGSVAGGNGPYPFRHLGNVDGLGDPEVADAADVAYLVDYYFGCGPCPVGDWYLSLCN
jgi:hypothetical protein